VREFGVEMAGVGSLALGAFGESEAGGTGFAGGFGHGGQDSFRFPGAREPDRLLLAGWEVSRFGQSWSVASSWARQQQEGQQD
jgi:hypothetical protein